MFDVKTNYKNKFKFNMRCRLCDDKNEEESEKHLLKCDKIIKELSSSQSLIDLSKSSHEQIFSDNIEEQTSIAKVYSFIVKTRVKLLTQSQ